MNEKDFFKAIDFPTRAFNTVPRVKSFEVADSHSSASGVRITNVSYACKVVRKTLCLPIQLMLSHADYSTLQGLISYVTIMWKPLEP